MNTSLMVYSLLQTRMSVQEDLVGMEHARIIQEVTAVCALRKGEGMIAKVRSPASALNSYLAPESSIQNTPK